MQNIAIERLDVLVAGAATDFLELRLGRRRVVDDARTTRVEERHVRLALLGGLNPVGTHERHAGIGVLAVFIGEGQHFIGLNFDRVRRRLWIVGGGRLDERHEKPAVDAVESVAVERNALIVLRLFDKRYLFALAGLGRDDGLDFIGLRRKVAIGINDGSDDHIAGLEAKRLIKSLSFPAALGDFGLLEEEIDLGVVERASDILLENALFTGGRDFILIRHKDRIARRDFEIVVALRVREIARARNDRLALGVGNGHLRDRDVRPGAVGEFPPERPESDRLGECGRETIVRTGNNRLVFKELYD